MSGHIFSPQQVNTYHKDGYVIVKKFCSKEETDHLYSVALKDDAMRKSALDLNDQSGKKTKLSLWFTPGNDVFGYLTRSEKMVHSTAQLLDSDAPVCHFHSKLMQKEPKVGGAWEWHQDYGYWYNNACLSPQLASCLIAVDRATKENGCLQVLKGSHHIGRIDHVKVGDQTGADMERVNVAMERLELVHCELEPGSAIFFHCNLLHCSAQNKSTHPRWALICCYNAASNNPYKESRHPRYSYLEKWPDSRIKEIGRRDLALRSQQ